jgi:hypothetical protein
MRDTHLPLRRFDPIRNAHLHKASENNELTWISAPIQQLDHNTEHNTENSGHERQEAVKTRSDTQQSNSNAVVSVSAPTACCLPPEMYTDITL